MTVVTLTDDNFEQEVTSSEIPVLVDYWATWCGPCKMVGPLVEEIASEYGQRLKVGKIDVDSNQDLALEQNVRSIYLNKFLLRMFSSALRRDTGHCTLDNLQ